MYRIMPWHSDIEVLYMNSAAVWGRMEISMKQLILPLIVLSVSLAGCGRSQPPPSDGRPSAKVDATATDIPIYDPEVDGEPLDMTEFPRNFQLMWEQIDPNPYIEEFNQDNGRYPENYAEFKSGVMEPYEVKFPENMPLPLGFRYDEENHQVVVVEVRSN